MKLSNVPHVTGETWTSFIASIGIICAYIVFAVKATPEVEKARQNETF